MEAELKRKNPAYQTMVQHNTLIKRLKQFGKIKTFKDFTYENIYTSLFYFVPTSKLFLLCFNSSINSVVGLENSFNIESFFDISINIRRYVFSEP